MVMNESPSVAYISFATLSSAALVAALFSITKWAPRAFLPSAITATAITLNRFKNFDEHDLPSTFQGALKNQGAEQSAKK